MNSEPNTVALIPENGLPISISMSSLQPAELLSFTEYFLTWTDGGGPSRPPLDCVENTKSASGVLVAAMLFTPALETGVVGQFFGLRTASTLMPPAPSARLCSTNAVSVMPPPEPPRTCRVPLKMVAERKFAPQLGIGNSPVEINPLIETTSSRCLGNLVRRWRG